MWLFVENKAVSPCGIYVLNIKDYRVVYVQQYLYYRVVFCAENQSIEVDRHECLVTKHAGGAVECSLVSKGGNFFSDVWR